MSNHISLRIDEITPLRSVLGYLDTDQPPQFGQDANIVCFTMHDWFEINPVMAPKMVKAISELEGHPLSNFDFSGSYIVNGNSRLTAGDVVTIPILPQLRQATTKDEILNQLQADPTSLVIILFGSSGWIVPTGKTAESDDKWGFIPSLCLVAEMLREGLLEIDGCGDIKLSGYAVPAAIDAKLFSLEWLINGRMKMKAAALRSATGLWFNHVSPEFKFGVIGEDLTLDECFEQIDEMGKREGD